MNCPVCGGGGDRELLIKRVATAFYNLNLRDGSDWDLDLWRALVEVSGLDAVEQGKLDALLSEWMGTEERNERYERFTGDASNLGGV